MSGGLDTRGITATPWTDPPETPSDQRAPGAEVSATAAGTEPAADWTTTIGLGVLIAAGALWVRSLGGVEARDMSAVGLLSVLPPTFAVAVALLTASFVVLTWRSQPSRPLLAAYVATFAVVSNATAVVVSGTLGNAWAWANVEVVDHVQRTGGLPAVDGSLAAPTEWPATYGWAAIVSDVAGIDAAELARWMPLGLTLVALLGLWVLLRAITADERIVWSALWLFVLGSWVGQGSLSPQALSLTLALALLAVALPLDRTTGPRAVFTANIGPADGTVGALAGTVAFIGLVGMAIVTSHQVTPLVLAATFAVAAATGASRTLWLAIGLAIATLAWWAVPAWSYVGDDPLGALAPLGSPAQFASTAGGGLSGLAAGIQAVMIAGRFVILMLVVLAVAGLVARWLGSARIGFFVAAIAAPFVLLLAAPSTESAIRAFLYALPWLAFAGGTALAVPLSARRRGIGTAGRLAVVGVLTVGFVIAGSGELGAGTFTAAEVDLLAEVSASAPAGTLLIQGTANGPGVGHTAERFTRVTLADEPAESLTALAADPEGTLHDRLVAARSAGYASALVVITHGQHHGESIAPRLPDGLLGTIEDGLRRSERFAVVAENADAVVFAIAEVGS